MISSDMSEYFSDKEKIKQLEVELSNEKRKNLYYRKQMEYHRRLHNDWEVETRTGERKRQALALIKELKGTCRPYILIKKIAEKCFLANGTVKNLFYAKTIIVKG